MDAKQPNKETLTNSITNGAGLVKLPGGLLRIPAPRTGNWAKAFGGWKGFVAEIHRSIGRNLGGGVLKLSAPTSRPDKKAAT